MSKGDPLSAELVNGGPHAVIIGDRENEKRRGPLVETPRQASTTINSPYDVDLPMDTTLYGWVVCAASFWTNGTIFGIINSFGVLYVKLIERFEDKENAAFLTSLVGSLCVGMTFLLSPVAGILTDKFGVRKTAFVGSALATIGMFLSSFVKHAELLYVTYGLMLGSGASLAYTPSLVILGHYFKRRMGLVNGIVTFGSSVFTIVLPIVLNELLQHIELQTMLQILGTLMSTLMLCSLLFRPRLILPKPHSMLENGVAGSKPLLCEQQRRTWKSKCRKVCSVLINTEIWKNKKYAIWAITIPFALFGYFVPYIHLVSHVKDIMPEKNGAILVTCIGITSGIGRIVFGLLADCPRVDRICLQQLSFFCIGILTMLLPLAGPGYFNWLIVMCLGLGLFDGCFISLLGPIAFDLTGPSGASQAIGFLLGLCSIPLTIGPPIAGLIYDHMKTYKVAFIVAGIPPIAGAAVMFLIRRVKSPVPVQNGAIPSQTIARDGHADGSEQATKLLPDTNGILVSDANDIWQKLNDGNGDKSVQPSEAQNVDDKLLEVVPISTQARLNSEPGGMRADVTELALEENINGPLDEESAV